MSTEESREKAATSAVGEFLITQMKQTVSDIENISPQFKNHAQQQKSLNQLMEHYNYIKELVESARRQATQSEANSEAERAQKPSQSFKDEYVKDLEQQILSQETTIKKSLEEIEKMQYFNVKEANFNFLMEYANVDLFTPETALTLYEKHFRGPALSNLGQAWESYKKTLGPSSQYLGTWETELNKLILPHYLGHGSMRLY